MITSKTQRLPFIVLCVALLFTLVPLTSQASDTYSYEVEVGTIVNTVNFRTGPSTDYEAIRFLRTDETVEVLEHVNSYWLKVVDTSGQVGYTSSSSKYISLSTVTRYKEPNAQIVRGVSFRTGPSTDYDRIRYLQEGELIWILEEVNSYWYKIVDQNHEIGYVSTMSKYVNVLTPLPVVEPEPEVMPEPEPEESQFFDEPNATIVRSVSFRTGPSTSYDRIRYLQSGEQVLVMDKHNQYWYKVQDSTGTIGYVSTSTTYIETSYVEPYKTLNYTDAAELVIAAGMKYMGTPYEFGSNRYDTTTFDCSDFVRHAFMQGIGQRIPGDSRSQGDHVRSVGKISYDWSTLQRGDLMFFMSYKGYKASSYEGIDKTTERITHVGIYLGDGQVLHTYSIDSGGVRIDSLEGSTWDYRFLFGGSTY